MRARIWLVAGAALIFCAGLAFVFAVPLRQTAGGLYNDIPVQWNEVQLRRSLAQQLTVISSPAGSLEQIAPGVESVASGTLRVSGVNPRYFADGAGRIVYLTGSHTWSNFQDNGRGSPPPVFDYNQYLDFLTANHHNFMRLWRWEQPRWTLETADDAYWFYPEGPWLRSGPDTALDGKPKWDLNQFDQSYFDRLRARVQAAGARSIYVSVMLFDGWSVSANKGGLAQNNPWRSHPFNAANNINGLNVDANNNNSGEESHQLGNPAALACQQAYVRKVIDTLDDLDNVLYEISNESHSDATAWQNSMVDYIKQYEATLPKQHPVGMTAEWPNGSDAELFASDADWISPSGSAYMSSPPDAGGQAVIILDTDHLWGIGGDRQWVWKSFTRGLNPIFMDGYDGAGYGVGGNGFNFNDPTWVKLRANLGYTLDYAQRINLAAMTPRSDLCSTTYCLASPTAPGAEFLVYQPNSGAFTVNLAGLSGSFSGEWLNPNDGSKVAASPVTGGATRTFTPPFTGDAVLYLQQAGSATPTITPTATPTATPVPKALFPSSPLLDKFNRPNGGMGVNWVYRPAGFRLAGHRLAVKETGAGVWQTNDFADSQEAFVRILSLDPATREVGVLLKGQGGDNALLNAVMVGYLPASRQIQVSILDKQGTRQVLSPSVPVSLAAGDQLGARVLPDGRVELFHNGALLGSVAAGANLNAYSGHIGLYIDYSGGSGSTLLDDFGGGVATFLPPPDYTIQVTASTVGAGTVQVEPSGAITCGQRVTITAAPAAGWQFGGWTGDVVETQNPLVYNLTGSLTVVANFVEDSAPQPYNVTVQVAGAGTVNVEPPGPYVVAQVIRLTAQPTPGWLFTGWSGAQPAESNPLTLQIAGDTGLTANFAPATNLYLPSIQRAADAAAASCE